MSEYKFALKHHMQDRKFHLQDVSKSRSID